MGLVKKELEYITVDGNFEPLPQHGHLSKKHPAFAAAEEGLRAAFPPMWESMDFPAFREAAGDADAKMPPGGPDRYKDITTELIQFPARDGQMIELKIYKSPKVSPNATLMYRMHGGGCVVGSHEIDGVENVYAAARCNVVVVSVKYRLAPENPFPTPFNDCYDGLLWCKANANVLGIDAEKVILSGSSAGGYLTAAVALEARDTNMTGIQAQVIHFPYICHPKLFPRDKHEFGSYIQNYDTPVLTALAMETAWDAYLQGDWNSKPDQRHSPLLAASLKHLPPTLIQAGGLDILRDDAFAYADELKKEGGVDVEFYCYGGLPHCFPPILDTIPETAIFYDRFTNFVKKYC